MSETVGSRIRGGPSLRVGLTGGIGSGKTAVADMLEARGAVIIDADVLAREVVEPGSTGLSDLVTLVGTEVLTQDGALDRAALGRLIFSDSVLRKQVESIIHPAVRSRAAEREAAAPEDSVIVHAIPLLVETGQQDSFDLVVVVDASRETQVQRIMSRNGLSRVEAESRIDAQASPQDRLAWADVVVPNDGSLDDLERQVAQLWAEIEPSGGRPVT